MKPQPQFTITGLLALTAAMAPAFAVIQWHDLMSWIQLGIPMVILCLIVIKSGARCLIGAGVGAVLTSASLLALIYLTGSLTDDNSQRIAGLIGIAYFGAAIGGGIHASSRVRRARLGSPDSDATAEKFSLQRVAIIPFALIAMLPGWYGGWFVASVLVGYSFLDDNSQFIDLIHYFAAIVGGMIGALVASVIFMSRSRTNAV
ncbi:hypothetical protein SH139x_002666 [Planctomycetaceae bacterium SH139]